MTESSNNSKSHIERFADEYIENLKVFYMRYPLDSPIYLEGKKRISTIKQFVKDYTTEDKR